jgi:alkylation response protein AidB-like acyl-CoA dehydrogenase
LREVNTIPSALLKKAAELGYFGLGIPEDYGGQGTDVLASTIFVEEVFEDLPRLYRCHTCPTPFFTYPVLVLRKLRSSGGKYIPPLARGEKNTPATPQPSRVRAQMFAGIETTAKKNMIGDGS